MKATKPKQTWTKKEATQFVNMALFNVFGLLKDARRLSDVQSAVINRVTFARKQLIVAKRSMVHALCSTWHDSFDVSKKKGTEWATKRN